MLCSSDINVLIVFRIKKKKEKKLSKPFPICSSQSYIQPNDEYFLNISCNKCCKLFSRLRGWLNLQLTRLMQPYCNTGANDKYYTL